ncbi:hypothetical protein [Nostoc sp.]|uniref:hypothetical protein n=1 Tax=Nostoc sp. TaxID=1180 RepID=UPI002FF57D4D
MAIAWAGGGQNKSYTLPTVRLQAVGKALEVNYLLIKQQLRGSAIAHYTTTNQSIVRLHRLQFFGAKILAVDGENCPQKGF